eukprot:SAG31_NODE_535_length_14348_cov_11.339603_2_plen_216_part_00
MRRETDMSASCTAGENGADILAELDAALGHFGSYDKPAVRAAAIALGHQQSFEVDRGAGPYLRTERANKVDSRARRYIGEEMSLRLRRHLLGLGAGLVVGLLVGAICGAVLGEGSSWWPAVGWGSLLGTIGGVTVGGFVGVGLHRTADDRFDLKALFPFAATGLAVAAYLLVYSWGYWLATGEAGTAWCECELDPPQVQQTEQAAGSSSAFLILS